ncbi:DUF4432 family protein [Compostimonas suwonensis]|uniref:Galactose mutarotase-like enzyme n=1 Tax=Compostimonas suwonensis TaxID=1048394 RepID=A0A2M9BCX8_9MICO|nr:DUF4432 family protein [Compostimonas suwonensis]PJJ55800.1 galactose mutarotase-like enzyme [Compostimonas suwonensis]
MAEPVRDAVSAHVAAPEPDARSGRTPTDYGALLRRGLYGRDTPLASVTDRLGVPGTADPARVLHARVADGLDVEVLPGRGFDIGDAYHRGTPLSWFSPVADTRPLDSPRGEEWLRRFTGGLLTTCGLGNIGPAREGDGMQGGEGMHGRASHTPATGIRHRTGARDGETAVTLEATIDSIELFGPSLRMERTIESAVDAHGVARLHVRDVVENIGALGAPLSLLYHLNLGAPLVVPGTTVRVPGASARPREPHVEIPDAATLPPPCDTIVDAVFEHAHPHLDAEGFAHASVTQPGGGMRLDVAWSAVTLPRLYQWVFPTRGRWALALEPATAPLFGPGRDEPHAGAPLLAPGERRRHELRITIAGAGA